MNQRLASGLIIAVAIAIFALALATAYNAWVSYSQHRNSCTARSKLVDAVEQDVQFFLTPQPGKTQTANEIKTAQEIQLRSNMILDQARC